MNAECLPAVYEQVAEASNAVSLLCRLVLDLAVRGELVEQNSHDGSASNSWSGSADKWINLRWDEIAFRSGRRPDSRSGGYKAEPLALFP